MRNYHERRKEKEKIKKAFLREVKANAFSHIPSFSKFIGGDHCNSRNCTCYDNNKMHLFDYREFNEINSAASKIFKRHEKERFLKMQKEEERYRKNDDLYLWE